MMQRSLGALRVGAVGLGCMGLSDFYGSLPPPDFDASEAVACIQRAIDLGVTLFDTADIYAYDDNEELVGSAIAGRRESVVVSSKFGILRRKEDPEWRGVNAHPSYVRSACEASLRRLRCDHIDLYLLHRPDPWVPIEETMQALGALVHEGKVRYVDEASQALDDLLFDQA
jgi:aryl-alcohol dehydrogenase-like predicted oxidoreductase